MTLRLAVDTSAAVSAAVLNGPHVLAAAHSYDPRRHAELLAPLIQQVLDRAGVTPADLTGLVTGIGPGPFTGLRVAVTTARVMAAALDVPVHGVVSLDALALAAVDRLGLLPGQQVLVATDARRREVYWARYQVASDQRAVRVDGPAVGAADRVLVGAAVCVGRGTLLYPQALPPAGDDHLLDPQAAWLGVVADRELSAGMAPRAPVPAYLRRPDATEPTRS